MTMDVDTCFPLCFPLCFGGQGVLGFLGESSNETKLITSSQTNE